MKANKKIILTVALFVMIALQLIVPFFSIISKEYTLRTGKAYKILIQPVDPYDVLRGKYLTLHPKEYRIDITNDIETNSDLPLPQYAEIGRDEDGYLVINKLSAKKPKVENYMRLDVTKTRYWTPESNREYENYYSISMPFERFYIEEKLAYDAEVAYNASSASNTSYIMIRVKNGAAVIEELYLEDTPVVEYVKEYIKTNNQAKTKEEVINEWEENSQ